MDNKLFLWKYSALDGASNEPGFATSPTPSSALASADCLVYDGITEVIVSVALTAPRPGVFLDSVKYLLVVASPLEVVLLAITCDAHGEGLQLLPTVYKMPSDNVAMVKVVGSQCGRVFMAGNDGNVYELDYFSGGIGGQSWVGEIVDTALSLGSGGGDGEGSSRRKCRKIKHSVWQWRVLSMLPPLLQAALGGGGEGEREGDGLVDLVVDNVRCVLYAVTARGTVSAF